MKKLLLGAVLAFSIVSCSKSDEIAVPTGTAHTFEFNAHTETPSTGKMARGTVLSYVLTVEAINKDGKVVDSKSFTSSIAEHFNCKLSSPTGDITLRVSVAPITIVVKDISFIPKNEITEEIGEIVEFVQLPINGILTAAYNEATKVLTATVPIESHELSADFGDKVSVMTKIESIDDVIKKRGYRTFTFDNAGKIISSRGYSTDAQDKDENSIVVYNETGKIVEIKNTDKEGHTSSEVIEYDGDNIISSVNQLESRYEIYRYNTDGRIRESVKNDYYNGNTYHRTENFTYYANDSIRVKPSDSDVADILVLNDNTNPLYKTIPAAFLKILATDNDMGGYNVKSSHKEGKHNADFDVSYEYVKDSKGRVIKQTIKYKTIEMNTTPDANTIKQHVEVTEFQYMSK